MEPARIGYSPTPPESPRAEKREPRSPRLSSIRRVLFPPPTRLQDMTVAPAEVVWTEGLLGKVGKLITTLPDDKDIAARATRLIKRTSGLTPGLAGMAAGKVKELPHDLRSRIFIRTCDLLAQESTEGEVRSLLKAINKAASDLDPQLDAGGLKAMRTLVASLGSGDRESIEQSGRDLQAIVGQRSGLYGRKDVELDQATGRLGYLGRWAKSALGDCTTPSLVAIFDGVVSNIKTARQPMHSRIGTALLDVLCPLIASQLAGSLVRAAIKRAETGEIERFYLFLYLGISRGSFDEAFVRATIVDVLASSGHSPVELRQIVAVVSPRNETVGRLLGEVVETHLAGQ